MPYNPPIPSLEQLRSPGSEAISVRADGSMAEVIEAFRAQSALRLLAVLDDGGRPVGAILERDVRAILFNPYGHALLRNRGFGGTLRARIRQCPVADVASGLGESLAACSRSGGGEGLILTRDGRYHGIVENHVLLNAAGAWEIDRMREREAQLDRLQAAGIDFRRDIETLSLGLAEVAVGLGGTAAETADRGRTTGHRAIAVTAAAAQTCQAMAEVASHSGALLNAFERLNDETATARSVARQAVTLVEAGSRRTDALYESSRSIETITTSIDGLAGRVNMLAINATIEAVRAGDAGRGFAVVANEVRALAAQTRAALQIIREHALAIRGAVSEVVTGHDGIARVVASVERISQTLESTVQAQRAATHEMAAGAGQAAAASREIEANVEAIGQAAAAAATGATGIQGKARKIEVASRQLTDRVAAFVVRMTAT